MKRGKSSRKRKQNQYPDLATTDALGVAEAALAVAEADEADEEELEVDPPPFPATSTAITIPMMMTTTTTMARHIHRFFLAPRAATTALTSSFCLHCEKK